MADTRDRLAATYHAAMKASSECACVSIHVGQQVWDDMLEMASRAGVTVDEKRALCWGFPVVLETPWPADTIKVCTTRIIL